MHHIRSRSTSRLDPNLEHLDLASPHIITIHRYCPTIVNFAFYQPREQTPSLVNMAKTRDATKETILWCLRARLARKSSAAPAEADTVLRAQVDFYTDLREALNVNTTNFEAIDTVAIALLASESQDLPSLAETVTLLSSPSSIQQGQASPHELFVPPSSPSNSQGKRPATKAKTDEPLPVKKQRKTKAWKQPYQFELPDAYPSQIKRDIERPVKLADDPGKTPHRLAYPWTRQRAWYDPEEYPDLYLGHWRFWMKNRLTFFACALYVPSHKSGACRKQKSTAIQARLIFLGMNIMTFGYYGFLDRFENPMHDNLMWLGGKDAFFGSESQRGHFDTGADRPGHSSQALGPTRPEHLRLRTEALTRIAIDISSAEPPNVSWVGNKSSGVWKRLLSDPVLHAEQIKIAKQLRAGTYACPGEVKSYKSFEHGEDDSDFEDETGSYTILPPTPPVNGEYPVASSDEEQERDDDEEVDDELEEKQRPDESDNGDQDEDQDEARDDDKHASDVDKKDDAGTSSKSK
ncbi:unnamed protein product [Phytophthora fragariaefolia]|uniref:Unnamed protein product n=1 Tax=Phytophthora fragariaefolia TaxID=1490495 RepID=A0A9W6TYU6_9STRA|nr:unnamed protein product [Phytophthora fragariaefolia]